MKRLQDELRVRNAELEAISRTDALTGLPNRRHLQESLTAAAASVTRHGGNLAILMIDVDHFKSINDRFGHDVGDVVLREVAVRLAGACRAEDVVGRWGGEEFLVVAPATDEGGGRALAERVRAAVAGEPIDLTSLEDPIPVTVSIGTAGGSNDVEDLLRRADGALYAAKSEGRNRVSSTPASG